MVNLDECKNPDGTMNWNKYNELKEMDNLERIAKGELCQRKGCRRWVMWAKGFPQTCDYCKAVDRPAELDHPSDVRCPSCGYYWRVGDGDYYELYEEGTHDVSCPSCGHDFEVNTAISHTFTSPERIKEPGSESDGQDS